MKNSSVLAAVCNQFPEINPKNISVFSVSSGFSAGVVQYEFNVMVLQDNDEFRKYCFKCSLSEIKTNENW